MNNLAFLPIGIAFFGFALTLGIRHGRAQKAASLLVAGAYTSFGAWILLSHSDHLPLHLQVGGWQAPFGITLAYDHLAALLVAVTGVVYFAVTLYSVIGKNVEDDPLLYPLVHALVCGISGAFTTGDLFNLYVWFEVILLTSFVLLSLGKERVRIAGALKYVVLNIISSLVFLLAAGLIYNTAHTLNLSQLGVNLERLSSANSSYVLSLNVLLFVAFAIKSALFPFFFWLPASYHHLSPTLSALFAGLLTKVGLYAIFRVNLFTFPEDDYMQGLLGTLACLSILIGAGGAIIQTNIRRIFGFHIISQVGYIALAGVFASSSNEMLRIAGISAGLFYMVHHILVKANLYLVSGLIRSVRGSENLGKLGGLIHNQGFIALLFAVPALSLSGIPPLSGFWAKLGLFQAMISSQEFIMVALMVTGGFFTVFSMSKIWLAAFWGEQVEEDKRRPSSAPLCSLLACLTLSLLTLAIGLFPDLLAMHARLAAESLVKGAADASR